MRFICAIHLQKIPAASYRVITEEEEIGLRDSKFGISDRGGRRSGIERRKVSILEYAPERRSGEERRGDPDRRRGRRPEEAIYLRRNTDRYMEFANTQKGLFLAVLLSLPLWAMIIFMIIRGVHL